MQGDSRLVSLGRMARSTTMNVSLLANCAISVFLAAVNDWRLWAFDDEEVDQAFVDGPRGGGCAA